MSRDRWSFSFALVVCLAILVIYFNEVFTSRGVILAGDILYAFPPYRSYYPENKVQNPLLGDPLLHMFPWFSLNREAFRRGQIPLWNQYVNAGAPLLANGQSAPFFPLFLLGYLLPEAEGWNLAILLKLILAFMGMWLFLSSDRLAIASRLFGSLTFMLSGAMMLWLGWPHTNVVMTLPWLFYTLRIWYVARRFRWASAFIVVVAVQFLGGFIEESAHVLSVTGLYMLYLMFTGHRSATERVVDGTKIFFMVIIGALLAAIQLVPFTEFLLESTVLNHRNSLGAHGFVPSQFVVTWLVPNYYGNPLYNSWSGVSNYNETVGYAGAVGLVLAVVGAVLRWRVSLVYSAIALVCLGMVYRVPWISALKELPLLRLALTARLLMTTAFFVAILAAHGVEALLSRVQESRATRASTLFVVSITFSYLALPIYVAFGREQVGSELLAERWVWIAMAVAFVLCAGVLVGARTLGLLSKRAFAALITVAQFVDLYNFSGNYNPVVPTTSIFPSIPLTEFLKQDMRPGDRMIGVNFVLPPNVSIGYRLPDFRNSDALNTARDIALMTEVDLEENKASNRYQRPVNPDVNILSVLGVTHVVGWASSPPGRRVLFEYDISSAPVGEIRGDQVLRQEFVSPGGPVGAVEIMMATYARQNRGTLFFRLERAGRVIREVPVDMLTIQDNSYFFFQFHPVVTTPGEKLAIVLMAPEAKPGEAVTVWYDPKAPEDGTTLTMGSQRLPGKLRFRVTTQSSANMLKIWEDQAGWAIWRLLDARPYVYFAQAAIKVTEQNALTTVATLRGGSDRRVVLEGAVPGTGPAEVISWQRVAPGLIRVAVKAADWALLIIGEKFAPGWRAKVGTQVVEPVRVNYCFIGVPVPPGEHEVVLEYRPMGWTVGWVVSAATLVSLGAFGGLRWCLRGGLFRGKRKEVAASEPHH